MVFYAYVISSTHKEEWRYIVAASSVEVMDAWYRYSRADGMNHLERKSPELYTYDFRKNRPYDFIYKDGKAASVKYKLVFTLIHNAWSIFSTTFFNQPFVPDHISGNTFYIRSKSNPRVFWNLHENTIVASKDARTRFKITSRAVLPGEVILPEDKITIAAIAESMRETPVQWTWDGNFFFTGSSPGGGPNSGPYGGPGYSPNPGPPAPGYSGIVSEFTFSDLKKDFLAIGKDVEEPGAKLWWFRDWGEEWELCS